MFSFAKGTFVTFFLSISISSCVDSSLYNEFHDLGASCCPRDSCRSNLDQTSLTDEEKTCECDVACHRRGTCCIDSPYVDLHPSARQEICSDETVPGIRLNFYFKYPSGRRSHSFFQKAKCPRNWRGSVKVIQLCETEKPVHGADILTAIPVTSFSRGITYKNYFCALCNNDIESSVLWDFSIFKDEDDISHRFIVQAANETYDGTRNSIITGREPCTNESSEALIFNLFGGDQGVYGHFDFCTDQNQKFHVTVTVSIPERLKHLVKGCPPELTSCCLPDWTDVRVKVLCESYFGIIKGPPRVNEYGTYQDQYFRNVHCALCNNVTNFDGYSCESFPATPVSDPTYPTSEIILLDHLECLADQERLSQGLSCRAGICVNPLHKLKDGKCAP